MANRFAHLIPGQTQQAAPSPAQRPANRFAHLIPAVKSADGKGDRVLSDAQRNRATFAGLADSFSVGFGDEIAGAIEAGVRKVQGDPRPVSEIYTNFRDKVRKGMEADQAAAPSDYLGGQVLGGVATLGVGTGARGAVQGGKAAITLGGKILKGMKDGAKYGALYGFGSGKDLKDSVEQGVIGAVTGGTVGVAVPVVGAAVKAPVKMTGNALQMLVNSGTEKYAAKQIARAAEREGKTVAQVQQELSDLQKINPDATVIDVLGESGGRLGRAVVNRGGKGARELSKGVYERQLGQNDRVNAQLSKSLGDPASYQKTLDDAIETLRTKAKPLYDRAYSVPINYQTHGPAITRAWSRVPPRLRGAVVSAANDLLTAEGKQAKKIGDVIGRRPDGKITPLPTVEQWDYIKRGLDAVIQAENTKGAAGGMSAIGRSLNNVKNDLMSVIDDAVPEFKAARAQYSDDLSVKNALELGRKSLNTDAELIAKNMMGMDSASRDTFRVGYARGMAEKINSMGPGGDAIGRLWAAPNQQKRLKAVFGNEENFRKFADFAAGEQKMRKSYNALGGNSTTAQQLNDLTDSGLAGAEPLLQAAGQAARLDFVGAAMTGLRKAVALSSGLSEARADAIAKVLASPAIPQGTVDRAGRYQMSQVQRAIYSQLLRNGASRSSAVAATGSTNTTP